MNAFTILEVLLGLILVLYCAISYLVASRLTTSRRRTISLGANFATIEFESRIDHKKLVGSFGAAHHSKLVVILVHGRNACRGWEFNASSSSLVAHLRQSGFNVFLIDLRGHGQSDPGRLTFGKLEHLDVLGAVDYLKSKGFEAGRIGVIGMSVGAVSAILAASQEPAIAGVVADSAFADFGTVMHQQFTRLSGLPNFFLYGALLVSRILTGQNMAAFRPVEHVARASQAFFFIHAAGDSFIASHHALQLASVSQTAQTWITSGSSHLSAFRDQPEEYATRVTAFLELQLGSRKNQVLHAGETFAWQEVV